MADSLPYAHLVNTVILLLWPVFVVSSKHLYVFILENPINLATLGLLMWLVATF